MTGQDPEPDQRGPLRTGSGSWPPELDPTFERTVTAEYSSLTRAGVPITVPTTPYVGASGTLDVSTGLTYPAKAERARRNAKVCLLFADPFGSGLERGPVVAVQGLAAVRDADLQANTDRYVRESARKLPETYKGQPSWLLRRLGWYFVRIWIEVTPIHILWWPSRELSEVAGEWHAPEPTRAQGSDPAPPGSQPAPWLTPPSSWHEVGDQELTRLTLHDLTVVMPEGYPLCLPATLSDRNESGFAVSLGPGAPPLPEGPACITLHTHPEVFSNQENRTILGRLRHTDGGYRFDAERALADWSLAGNRISSSLSFIGKRRALAPRLRLESERRGQPVPTVHPPG